VTKPSIAPQRLSDPGAVRRYFAGTWSLTRRIIDRRAGLAGHFAGEAILRPDMQGFDYGEAGSMRFGNYEGRASQSYRWDIDAAGTLMVRFHDGRLFHALDLSGGDMAVAHLCAADLYRGRFRLVDDVCWLSRWQVSGPRKDQLILNRYRRMPSPS